MFIKRAAILYQRHGILEGKDYGRLVNLGHRLGFTSSYITGYIDSNDNFIDKIKALEIARAAGQVADDYKGPLYPEDIFGAKEDDNAID